MTLRSPATGAELTPDGHSLAGPGGERWPVIDGIPFLRTGREALVRRTLAALDAGERETALALLLADQDDWWRGEPADPLALLRLIEEADRLPLRDAVRLIGFGPVGDYFIHRWSDPTFLAGLALLEAHWTAPASAFELACGIGHYLRELARRGVACLGVDVVFAKLWLARHWVVPAQVELVCFDAAHPWPTASRRFDLAFCHDAFYFLEPKAEILARLRVAAPLLAIGHVHNRDNAGFSAGRPVSVDDLVRLFPDGLVYDDAELTAALADGRAPEPQSPHRLRHVEAFAVTAGPALRTTPRALSGGLAVPPPGTPLRRNPLYAAGRLAWPSERYAAEYGPLVTYPPASAAPEQAVLSPAVESLARRRELVDLPERW